MCLAYWDVFLVSVVVIKTLGHCFAPRMKGCRGSHQEASYTDTGTFLFSYECFISQASGCVQVKIPPPHHKTKPTYTSMDWSRHGGPASLCEFSCEKKETSVNNVSDNIKLFKALKSLGSGPVCGFLWPPGQIMKKTVWNNLRWGKNPFSSALWFFLL